MKSRLPNMSVLEGRDANKLPIQDALGNIVCYMTHEEVKRFEFVSQ
jgi:hypothetical protein